MTLKPEMLFVDPYVSDIPAILGGLRGEVEAIRLDGLRPAARQIAEALRSRSGLDAIHVMAHGAPGRVSFAAGEWSEATLERDAEDLAAIGASLREGGEQRLWACETGRGAAGEAFVLALAGAAGADVAAASGLVGAEYKGGTWALLSRAGRDARPPLTNAGAAAYSAVLAVDLFISGRIPDGTTTKSVTYFVLDKARNTIVGNVTVPDASTVASAFRLKVTVPQLSESFDVGLFDDAGPFVSAGFQIEAPTAPVGAVGRR